MKLYVDVALKTTIFSREIFYGCRAVCRTIRRGGLPSLLCKIIFCIDDSVLFFVLQYTLEHLTSGMILLKSEE